jgi:hypothetical protein
MLPNLFCILAPEWNEWMNECEKNKKDMRNCICWPKPRKLQILFGSSWKQFVGTWYKGILGYVVHTVQGSIMSEKYIQLNKPRKLLRTIITELFLSYIQNHLEYRDCKFGSSCNPDYETLHFSHGEVTGPRMIILL